MHEVSWDGATIAARAEGWKKGGRSIDEHRSGWLDPRFETVGRVGGGQSSLAPSEALELLYWVFRSGWPWVEDGEDGALDIRSSAGGGDQLVVDMEGVTRGGLDGAE
jgi:hypothetical protein